MNKVLLILSLVLFSCASSKSNKTTFNAKSFKKANKNIKKF